MSGEAQGFATQIVRDGSLLTGPLRTPRQMLSEQEFGGHASVHDEATAVGLGLGGAPIEGPTHFSQFDPLAVSVWGPLWFERGGISAHFETMVFEGEEVRASMNIENATRATGELHRATGERVLVASLTIGDEPTALDARLARAQSTDAGTLHLVDCVHVGWRSPAVDVSIVYDELNGDLYPFSLAEKLDAITERSSWYMPGTSSPWARPIIPTEMLSVLAYKAGEHPAVRQPTVALFVDLEVRRRLPVFVGERYTLTREVVCVGQSRRVESVWTVSKVTNSSGQLVMTMLLHEGFFKATHPDHSA